MTTADFTRATMTPLNLTHTSPAPVFTARPMPCGRTGLYVDGRPVALAVGGEGADVVVHGVHPHLHPARDAATRCRITGTLAKWEPFHALRILLQSMALAHGRRFGAADADQLAGYARGIQNMHGYGVAGSLGVSIFHRFVGPAYGPHGPATFRAADTLEVKGGGPTTTHPRPA